jgi:hypothetical protein
MGLDAATIGRSVNHMRHHAPRIWEVAVVVALLTVLLLLLLAESTARGHPPAAAVAVQVAPVP